MNKLLSKRNVVTKLKSLHPDWEVSKSGATISRTCIFHNYMTGFMFVTKVSVRAEVACHHPDILLTYSSVKITLTTHDVKGLTVADFELATIIDSLYDLSTKKVKGVHNHY